jgi:mono/diheme cytochrome c family protein
MLRIGLGCLIFSTSLVGAAGALGSSAHRSDPVRPASQENSADDIVARGRYLVTGVALCGRCHAPSNRSGEGDPSTWLMGGPVEIRPTIPTPDWAVVAPRLAGLPPGTDEEFVRLLMTGISRTGRPPRPPMPQFHMTRADAEAVLAYLKSLGGERARFTR